MENTYFFGATVKDLLKANLVTIGIPWDASSSFRKGSSKAPEEIRKATSSRLYNSFTESLTDIRKKWQIFDYGDVNINTLKPIEARDSVAKTIASIHKLNSALRYLFLGGDHLSTFFSIYSLYKTKIFDSDSSVGIIYLDAHPDLYTEYDQNLYSHACIIPRLIAETSIKSNLITEIGIRAPTTQQIEFAGQNGIKLITRKEFHKKSPEGVAKMIIDNYKDKVESIYLSIDLDVLDPAFAPGLGNPEPGGLATVELIDFLQELSTLPIFAFDLVELNPKYDVSNISSFAAGKIIREILGIIKN